MLPMVSVAIALGSHLSPLKELKGYGNILPYILPLQVKGYVCWIILRILECMILVMWMIGGLKFWMFGRAGRFQRLLRGSFLGFFRGVSRDRGNLVPRIWSPLGTRKV